jgi:hypothetical protein
MPKSPMVKWSGQKIAIAGWWAPAPGERICGIVMQKQENKTGRIAQPFFVLQLTEENTIQPVGNPESVPMPEGTMVAVPENFNLEGMDKLMGYEVQITCTGLKTFNTGYGDERTVKEFEILHSAKPVKDIKDSTALR